MAKAHIKGIKNDGLSGSPMCIITITTQDKPVRDLNFNLPYSATALNLNVGDLVKYDSTTAPGTKTEMVLYCERVTNGVIASVAGDNTSGVITETDSSKPINFLQTNQDLNGLKVGTAVKYTLVSASAYSFPSSSSASAGSSSVSSSLSATDTSTPNDDLAIEVRVDPNP